MESHRIGIISDTHGILRPEVEEVLKSCEVIFHAGDIGKPEILSRLKTIADTYAVLGNVDQPFAEQFRFPINGRSKNVPGEQPERTSEELPEELEMELFGFRIYMIHNKKQMRKDLSGMDIVIYGHSHKYEETSIGNTVCLNPGSCGPKRFRLPVTMIILTLYPAEHQWKAEKIDCLSITQGMLQGIFGEESGTGRVECRESVTVAEADEEIKIPEQDMYRLVREMMKEIDAGRNLSDIAARHRIDEKFAEQVCRMYVTHPGWMWMGYWIGWRGKGCSVKVWIIS